MVREVGRVVIEAGDPTAAPGTRPWAVSLLHELQSGLADIQTTNRRISDLLGAMERTSGWRHLEGADGRSYPTYEAFCAAPPPFGLGIPVDELKGLLTDASEASVRVAKVKQLHMLEVQDQQDRRERGGQAHNQNARKDKTNVDIINIRSPRPDGTSSQLSLRRLRKARPELHQQVLAGEKSPHSAMVEAGLRKKTVSVEFTIEGFARFIHRRFSEDERATLKELL